MAFRTASYRIDHVGWQECIRRVFCFRSLADFKACYQPKAAECNNDVIFSMTFGTVEKTIDYLCVEGFNGNLVNKQLYMYRLLRAWAYQYLFGKHTHTCTHVRMRIKILKFYVSLVLAVFKLFLQKLKYSNRKNVVIILTAIPPVRPRSHPPPFYSFSPWPRTLKSYQELVNKSQKRWGAGMWTVGRGIDNMIH